MSPLTLAINGKNDRPGKRLQPVEREKNELATSSPNIHGEGEDGEADARAARSAKRTILAR